MLRKLKKLKNPIDLSKNPDFKIHKPIFRIALLSIFILFAVALFIDGASVLHNGIYIECPIDSVNPCSNPLYVETDCSGVKGDLYCIEGKEFLEAGETIGEKPSFLSSNFFFFVILIIAISIGANKLYFRKKDEVGRR